MNTSPLTSTSFESFKNQESNKTLVDSFKYGVIVVDDNGGTTPTEITESDFSKYYHVLFTEDHEYLTSHRFWPWVKLI